MIVRTLLGRALVAGALPAAASDRAALDLLIAQHAAAHGIPDALVHRIVKRESGYNPRASSRGNLGLMQIKYATARGMGYTGPASGLLDANTNLTYGVAYLANAYMVADGHVDRAVSLYTGGYYYIAKRKGLLKELRTGASAAVLEGEAAPADLPSLSSWLSNVFSPSETPAP